MAEAELASQMNASPVADELPSETSPEPANKLVRFVHAVPKFVGPELEEYGPFQEEDVANLPSEVANVLITKGRAEALKQTA